MKQSQKQNRTKPPRVIYYENWDMEKPLQYYKQQFSIHLQLLIVDCLYSIVSKKLAILWQHWSEIFVVPYILFVWWFFNSYELVVGPWISRTLKCIQKLPADEQFAIHSWHAIKAVQCMGLWKLIIWYE